jgi:membrane protease YdiL (CAAX protease family)
MISPARPRDPARSDVRLIAWSLVVGTSILLAFAGQYLVEQDEAETSPVYTWEFAASGAATFAIVLGIVLLISIDAPKRRLLALTKPRHWGIAAALAFGTLVAVSIVALALEPFLDASGEQGLTPDGWEPDRAPQFVGALITVGFFAPVGEELLFRGLGFSLLSRFGRWYAILITATSFALAHGLLRGFLPLFVFGIGMGVLRDRTNSVYPAMLVHSAFNTIGMIAAVTAGG